MRPGRSEKEQAGLDLAGTAFLERMGGNLIWLGAILGVLASMSGTAGKQLLRFAHLQGLKGTQSARFMSKVAIALGLALNVAIGPLIDMASYAFAPQSIIAPLGGLDVVWNTVSAPCTLGETLTPMLIFGCLLIAGGATATSIFGSHEESEYTPELLKDKLFRWEVFGYCIALALWLVFNILILIPRSAAPKGELFATGDKIRGLSLGMTAGSIAGNMFCVKAFVEVVQASIRDNEGEYWADWLPYVLLVGAVFFATSNLYFLTKAMREYEALFMGAIFEGSLIVAACVSGCVVFSEMDGLAAWEVCLYWLAVLVIVAGIMLVALGCAEQEKTREVVDATVDEKKVQVHKEIDIVVKVVGVDQVIADTELGAATPTAATPVSRSVSKTSNSNPFRGVPLPVAFAEDSRIESHGGDDGPAMAWR